MSLNALIDGLPLRLERGSGELVLADLVEDSRRVTPGSAFLARQGDRADGRAFVADAVARGAAAVITDIAPPPDLPDELAWVRAQQADTPLAAALGERFFDHPSRKLHLIGVTGTNGKTTTAALIQHLLNTAQCPCGLIGTLGAHMPTSDTGDDETRDTGLTTPGPIDFSRLLAHMRDRGCRAVVTEVSSHALEQGRTRALSFDVGVFTNLTGDHLDYHGSIDAYAAAKARLFAQLGDAETDGGGWAVVNAQDPYAGRMLEAFTGPSERVLRCSVSDVHARESMGFGACWATVLSLAAHGSRARFDGPWGSVEAALPLVGRHNIANALQATAAAHTVVDLSPTLARALANCPPVPGRLERVALPEAAVQPSVLVDYAHTHDALENVLSALRPLAEGRLCVVFGCGGDRDRGKRPKMAQAAARFADEIWVTSDNPRSEDPQRIIDDIMAGFADGDQRVHVEPDRARAIVAAMRHVQPTDTLLIAGKGHEDYQILADRTIHFDDREQAAAALRQWQKERSAKWPLTG